MLFIFKYIPYLLISLLILFINTSNIYNKINIYLITIFLLGIFEHKNLNNNKNARFVKMLVFIGNIILTYILINKYINVDFITTYIALIWLFYLYLILSKILNITKFVLFAFLVISFLGDNTQIIKDYIINNANLEIFTIKNIELLVRAILLVYFIRYVILYVNKLILKYKFLNNNDSINLITIIIMCVFSVILLKNNNKESYLTSYALYIFLVYISLNNIIKLKKLNAI